MGGYKRWMAQWRSIPGGDGPFAHTCGSIAPFKNPLGEVICTPER